MKTVEPFNKYHDGANGLVLETSQDITDDFQRILAEIKANEAENRKRELYPVAMIPTVVIEKWKREGFPFDIAPRSEIIARLKREGLDDFILGN